MTLAPGTRIGSYEILGKLGAGGMGEVYQARDTKLNRNVALKVLPPQFIGDADRLARLRREAQLLASLNHPNIAGIYGFEDSTGVYALIMELVPGRTLAERVSPAMPLDEALAIVRQIAAGLEAAHEQGVVHRDLKPANVKVTDDGAVKILDFGLAKALGPEASRATAESANSPTITTPAMTAMGIILGTAGYMAPEQAKGKPVDRRADIWALGVVLFELLSGAPLYRGETVTDTIAQLITQPPRWDALPPSTSAAIRRLLRRCLEKDPRNRYQSAGDVRIEIEEFLSAPVTETAAIAPAIVKSPPWPRWLPWGIAAALLAALVISAWTKDRAPVQPFRFEARLGTDEAFRIDPNTDGAMAVLSPQGTAFAYVAEVKGVFRLFYRPLDRLESTAIAGAEGAVAHFFSPDGRSIGFFVGASLKRIPIAGGAPIVIAPAIDGRGGTWGPDDTIVFTPSTSAGLFRVPASGGTPVELTHLQAKERTHRWPSFLPDGKSVLFICQLQDASYDDGTIEAVRLDTGERKVLVRGGTFPKYLPSGHLVYTRQGTLFAVAFDPARLEVRGDPKPIIGNIVSGGTSVGAGSGNGASQFSVADNGVFAYIAGAPERHLSRLTIVNRTGATVQSLPERQEFRGPRFSPDGKQIAVEMMDGKADNVYLFDRSRKTLTRMTFDTSLSGFPVWSPDGRHIAHFSDRGRKGVEVFMIRSDAAGEPEAVTTGGDFRVPGSFTPDGRSIVGMQQGNTTGMDIFAVSIADKTVTTILNSPANETLPALSPDGKWIAYQSDESGAPLPEVFVRAYPGGGGKRQVSTASGFAPFWTKGGREIVFATPSSPPLVAIIAVEVTPQGDGLSLGPPKELFKVQLSLPPNSVPYGVSSDGSQFAVLLAEAGNTAPKQAHVTIVSNLFDEIRKALAGDRK